ncbi:MAG: helix-hairpin-helix domain-containing protein [Planctomycetaceae bacterium]|jgi:competence ComEA-like helix-hairpin-helix protein|nr:helix-hairpin-helix domain-containing protein [Planctomycetaceae bacterium]
MAFESGQLNLDVGESVISDADNLSSTMVLRKQDRVVIAFFLTMLFLFFLIIHFGASRNADDDIVLSYEFYINPNNATKAEIQTLPGIGVVLSRNIVNYRKDSVNQFDNADDLLNVNQIGKKKVSTIRSFIKIDAATNPDSEK